MKYFIGVAYIILNHYLGNLSLIRSTNVPVYLTRNTVRLAFQTDLDFLKATYCTDQDRFTISVIQYLRNLFIFTFINIAYIIVFNRNIKMIIDRYEHWKEAIALLFFSTALKQSLCKGVIKSMRSHVGFNFSLHRIS